MLQPQDVEIDGKVYILSKFPAVAGREIVAKYPLSGMPKIGDYKVNEETMLKLMAYVGVRLESGTVLQLQTRALVDNHVPSWEVLAKLEWSMLEYNCSFFGNGRASTFLEGIAQKLPSMITSILMDLSLQLSAKNKQPSTNSEPSTP